MSTRRKNSPTPLHRATEPRALEPATANKKNGYASIVARARALGLYAVVTIAPMGLAGSVAACGGARPVEAYPRQPGPNGYVPPPPVQTIAPPGATPAPSTSAPAPMQSE